MVNVPEGDNNDSSDNSQGPNYRRMQQFRNENSISRGRNIAFVNYDINGESDSQFAISKGDFPGTVPMENGGKRDVPMTQEE